MATIPAPIIGADSMLASGGRPDVGSLGHAAQERLNIRERKLTELELRGEIKPATILNLSPFPLKVETGLWDYTSSREAKRQVVWNPHRYPGRAASRSTAETKRCRTRACALATTSRSFFPSSS